METNPISPAVESTSPHGKKPKRAPWKWILILAAGAAVFIAFRSLRGTVSPVAPTDSSVTVAVAKVAHEDLFNAVKIPAEFHPYLEVELHAKVSGYVSQMNVDIGYQVKAGNLLATLEVPELQDQLHNAIAVQEKAEADYTNEHLICVRLQTVNQQLTNAIAQQDLDTAAAKERSAFAAIAAAKADREKYETLSKYTKITAPFDGVITKRYADPGALIQAGTASDTQSLPLVRLSDNYRLRLDFYVDVDNIKDIHLGDPVDVRVDSLGEKTFTGTISLCTYRVEQDTRKMTVEVEVPNPKLELVPGMYATVVLKLNNRLQVLTVPTQAVTTGAKPTVFVVNDSGQIEERQVTLGLETPDKYEIKSGVKEGEMVVIGKHALARVGQKVVPKLVGIEASL